MLHCYKQIFEIIPQISEKVVLFPDWICYDTFKLWWWNYHNIL